MNYFELFDIPVQLSVEKGSLTRKFYQLSREYHPDHHSNSSADRQESVLQQSSQVNKAYKILQNTDETIKYVLQLKGLLHEEEKYDLDPDFLEQMMDINEALMELQMDPNDIKLEDAESMTKELIHKIYADVGLIIENYKEGITSEEELLHVKEYYYRKKYLQRILDKIGGMRNIAGL